MADGESLEILLATTNPHKLDEINAVFAADAWGRAVRWRLLDEVSRSLGVTIDEPVEDQDTFEGNAILKARHYADATGMVCVADDSGLEVDALGGRPGIHSARYSGVQGGREVVDPANNRKLLEELADISMGERTARFVCAMALAFPGVKENVSHGSIAAFCVSPLSQSSGGIVVRGSVEGRILLPTEADDAQHPERGRGSNGFGYDPLFVLSDNHPDHAGMTTAQLTADQKNAISHRGHAARLLLDELRNTSA